jgi:pyrroloquinoline quinone biosynthesis protein D
VNAQAVPRFAPGVRLRKEGEGTSYLLIPEGVLELNGSAVSILNLVDGKRTVGEIAAALAQSFEASPDQLSADVGELCDALGERGFLIS